jgi:hypothetical protein
MKVIIAGGRNIENYDILLEAIEESKFEITHVISGGANGVDTMAVEWAKEQEIPWTVFPAKWKKYRALGRVKEAGHIRNRVMAENGEALIAIWDGQSTGTANMIENAERRKLPIYIKRVEPFPKKEAYSQRKKLDPEFFN